jgi:transposase-like protein
LIRTFSGFVRRKVERPSKEELVELIKNNNGNVEAVARIFKITSNSFRKWLKSYNMRD